MKKYTLFTASIIIVGYMLFSFFTPYSFYTLKKVSDEKLNSYLKDNFIDKKNVIFYQHKIIDKKKIIFTWKYQNDKKIRFINISMPIFPSLFDESLILESELCLIFCFSTTIFQLKF